MRVWQVLFAVTAQAQASALALQRRRRRSRRHAHVVRLQLDYAPVQPASSGRLVVATILVRRGGVWAPVQPVAVRPADIAPAGGAAAGLEGMAAEHAESGAEEPAGAEGIKVDDPAVEGGGAAAGSNQQAGSGAPALTVTQSGADGADARPAASALAAGTAAPVGLQQQGAAAGSAAVGVAQAAGLMQAVSMTQAELQLDMDVMCSMPPSGMHPEEAYWGQGARASTPDQQHVQPPEQPQGQQLPGRSEQSDKAAGSMPGAVQGAVQEAEAGDQASPGASQPPGHGHSGPWPQAPGALPANSLLFAAPTERDTATMQLSPTLQAGAGTLQSDLTVASEPSPGSQQLLQLDQGSASLQGGEAVSSSGVQAVPLSAGTTNHTSVPRTALAGTPAAAAQRAAHATGSADSSPVVVVTMAAALGLAAPHMASPSSLKVQLDATRTAAAAAAAAAAASAADTVAAAAAEPEAECGGSPQIIPCSLDTEQVAHAEAEQQEAAEAEAAVAVSTATRTEATAGADADRFTTGAAAADALGGAGAEAGAKAVRAPGSGARIVAASQLNGTQDPEMLPMRAARAPPARQQQPSSRAQAGQGQAAQPAAARAAGAATAAAAASMPPPSARRPASAGAGALSPAGAAAAAAVAGQRAGAAAAAAGKAPAKPSAAAAPAEGLSPQARTPPGRLHCDDSAQPAGQPGGRSSSVGRRPVVKTGKKRTAAERREVSAPGFCLLVHCACFWLQVWHTGAQRVLPGQIATQCSFM